MITGKITITHSKFKKGAKGTETSENEEPKVKQNDKKISRDAFHKRKALMKELRQLLHLTYPTVFDYLHPKPLAIGIHKEIWGALPQYSQKTIRLFLGQWVKDKRYLQSFALATHRVNLSNEAVSELLDSEKEITARTLNQKTKSEHETKS